MFICLQKMWLKQLVLKGVGFCPEDYNVNIHSLFNLICTIICFKNIKWESDCDRTWDHQCEKYYLSTRKKHFEVKSFI